MAATDPFEALLNLEETYYNEGYALGTSDGSRAGRIEGRLFGLEKGFEKFVSMGTLHGKATILAARLPRKRSTEEEGLEEKELSTGNKRGGEEVMPQLKGGERLEKHVRTLYALVKPESLDTRNTEDAIAEFDARLKRAQAKVKVLERLIGEGERDGKKEDFEGTGSPKRVSRVKVTAKVEAGSMEDFVAPKGLGI
ncbi:DUF1715-domain-containing protein [Patellaria atrata CBS 101060]|uniref:DUF1715-domain-containing protein n=1 Tax=Patellaria atrata CBS 101060 TaxID=1346257 RepID=A0A9P4VTA8_9PEZI|nr:DUF1715-domain-containing protein [Patellaria atrata CBS 101060]